MKYPTDIFEVSCPYPNCQAGRGKKCETLDGVEYPRTYVHDARRYALEAAQETFTMLAYDMLAELPAEASS
jgi:hypothetical protein